MSYLSNFRRAGNLLPDEFRVFPTPFGNGQDGDVIVSATTDGGCVGSFGFRQARNLTISSGVFLQAPAGSTKGGIILAVSDTLYLSGGLRADGGNATSGNFAGNSGTGGAGAGGAVALAGQPSDSPASGALEPGLSAIGAGFSGGYGAYIVGTQNQTRNAGQSRMYSLSTVPQQRMRADGLPYQQGELDTSVVGLGSVVKSAWSKHLLVGGGAHGGGGCVSSSNAGARACAGGSGGGGGLIYVAARQIVFGPGASLSALGGSGGDGHANDYTWVGYGGRGGCGGRIILLCESYSGTPPSADVRGGLNGRDYVNSAFVPTSTRSSNGEFSLLVLR